MSNTIDICNTEKAMTNQNIKSACACQKASDAFVLDAINYNKSLETWNQNFIKHAIFVRWINYYDSIYSLISGDSNQTQDALRKNPNNYLIGSYIQDLYNKFNSLRNEKLYTKCNFATDNGNIDCSREIPGWGYSGKTTTCFQNFIAGVNFECQRFAETHKSDFLNSPEYKNAHPINFIPYGEKTELYTTVPGNIPSLDLKNNIQCCSINISELQGKQINIEDIYQNCSQIISQQINDNLITTTPGQNDSSTNILINNYYIITILIILIVVFFIYINK